MTVLGRFRCLPTSSKNSINQLYMGITRDCDTHSSGISASMNYQLVIYGHQIWPVCLIGSIIIKAKKSRAPGPAKPSVTEVNTKDRIMNIKFIVTHVFPHKKSMIAKYTFSSKNYLKCKTIFVCNYSLFLK